MTDHHTDLEVVHEALRVGDVGKALALYRRLTGARLGEARVFIAALMSALPAGEALPADLLDDAFRIVRRLSPLQARQRLAAERPDAGAMDRDQALRRAADLACRAFELADGISAEPLGPDDIVSLLAAGCPGFSADTYREACDYGVDAVRAPAVATLKPRRNRHGE